MSKMPLPRQQHRHPEPIRGLDDLVVAVRSAGLNHGCSPGRDCGLETVREREERITRKHAALEGQAHSFGLGRGRMNRIDSGRCASTDRERPVRSGEDDRIALHVLHDAPRELHRLPLCSAGLDRCRKRRRHHFIRRRIRLLNEQPAKNASNFELPRIDLLPIEGQQAPVLFLLEQCQRVRSEAWRDQHLGEDLVDPLRKGEIEGAVRDDDPAEGRIRVGRERVFVGLDRRRPGPHTAGRVVLEDRNDCPIFRARGAWRSACGQW